MRSRPTVVISILLPIVATLAFSETISAAGATSWPKTIDGRAHVHGATGPVNSGTLVTSAELKKNGSFQRTYSGDVGYGLLVIDPYQYPAITTDHGKHWRVDGGYFGVFNSSVMGSGVLATDILAVGKTDAIAYNDGRLPAPLSAIRVTTDSGKAWFVASLPGSVRLVSVWRGVTLLITIAVTSPNRSDGTRDYVTTNGGGTWTLVATP